MCGLFGFIERKPGIIPADKKMFLTRTLAFKTEIRGNQSWGIYARNESAEPGMIYKGMGTFRGCRRDKERNEYFKKSSLLMGHCRFATHGGVNFKNCHPFDHDNYILAHNGVLSSTLASMTAQTTSMPAGETDSELFLHWFVSTKQTWEKAIDIGEYYEAFTVYDKTEKDLIFLCLGRQLAYIETPDFIIYASDPVIVRSSFFMVFDGSIPEVKETESGLYRVNKNQGVHLIKARTFAANTEYWKNRFQSGFNDFDDDGFDWRNPAPDTKKDKIDLPDWNNPAKEWSVKECRWVNKVISADDDGDWRRGRTWDGVLQKWVDPPVTKKKIKDMNWSPDKVWDYNRQEYIERPKNKAGFLPKVIDTKKIERESDHDRKEYARQLALINTSENDTEGTELDPDMPCPVDVYIKRGAN